MARVFMDGAECGNLSLGLWDYWGGNLVLQAGNLDGVGSYLYKLWTGGFLQKDIPAAGEYYFALLWHNESISAYITPIRVLYGDNSLVHIKTSDSRPYPLQAYVGSTLVATGSAIHQSFVSYFLEVYIKIDNTNGRIVVKNNGIIDIDYTGDTQPGTDTQINRFKVAQETAAYGYFDNIVVDNANWIGHTKIQGLVPNGVGNSTQWTPSAGANWECVDERPPSDTDFVETNTVDQVDLYTVSNLTPPIVSVKSIMAITRMQKEGAPVPLNAQIVCRSGGVNYFSGNKELTTAWRNEYHIWENDPNTTNPWIESGINALEIGIKSVT